MLRGSPFGDMMAVQLQTSPLLTIKSQGKRHQALFLESQQKSHFISWVPLDFMFIVARECNALLD